MYVAELLFSKTDDFVNKSIVVSKLQVLVTALQINGQITGKQNTIVQLNNEYKIFVHVQDAYALDSNLFGSYISYCINSLIESGVKFIGAKIIGVEPTGSSSCQCKSHSFSILYSSSLIIDSPIRCGNCFFPIPIYKLQSSSKEDFGFLFDWQDKYNVFDFLFLESGEHERYALEQLSSYKSDLSEDGVMCCETISSMIKMPVYYHLLKKEKIEEILEFCPKCRGKWILKVPLFGKFKYQCHKCMFVS